MRMIFGLAAALILTCVSTTPALARAPVPPSARTIAPRLPPQIPPPATPEVTRSETVNEAGVRTIKATAVVAATPGEIWRDFETGEAWKRMGVGFVAVDAMKVGGVIESAYQPTGKAGDPGNIRNEIIFAWPERLLAIRNVQAPPGFPHAAEYRRTVTLIDLTENGPGETLVNITGAGFAPGAAYDALLAFFGPGNAQSLEAMAKSYLKGR
jgi:hypothetical protein